MSDDLHNLLRRALERIEELEARLGSHGRDNEAVAIVGIGCRLPGGVENPAEFWQLLESGRDAVSDGGDRWPRDAHDEIRSRPAGYLRDVRGFDAAFFGISPREAAVMDPQQRMLLEVAWAALEDGGQSPETLRNSQTGVFVGLSAHDYRERVLADPERWDAAALTGNGLCFDAGRISFCLDLRGPAIGIDTACSGGLVAVHLACRSLRSGESDVALAGAANLILSATSTTLLARTQALAADGRCKAFDAEANGFGRGEGCAVIALKRLADALRDGHPIRAVVRGSATNQDGSSTGFTTPNVLAQQELLRLALRDADVDPADVGYVEAHGTGTSLGDPIELEALRAVVGTARGRRSPCRLGSVKSNLGHLEAAAGIAGLVKAVLALEHECLPPSLHFKTPNPRLTPEQAGFEIPTSTCPWPRGEAPRIAGISAFGLSGTNCHVVVEEAPRREPPPSAESETELVVLSARSAAALQRLAARWARYLEDHPDVSLPDLAYTARVGRSHFPFRAAFCGAASAEIQAVLAQCAQAPAPPAPAPPRPEVVLRLRGDSAAGPRLIRRLEAWPAFRQAVRQSDAFLRPHLERPLRTAWLDDDPCVPARWRPAVALALEMAVVELWRSWGIRPGAVLSAEARAPVTAWATGVVSQEDALRAATGEQTLPADWRPGETAPTESTLAFEPGASTTWEAVLRALGDLYTAGVRVAWEAFDLPLQRRRLALPTYPFEHAPHWIDADPATVSDRRGGGVRPVGDRLWLANGESHFPSTVDSVRQPYLADHQVFGEEVAPAAFHLAFVLAAASRLEGSPGVLERVFFPQALRLRSDLHCDLTCSPTAPGTWSFRFSSLKVDESWLHHAAGTLATAPPRSGASSQLALLQRRYRTRLDTERFYGRLQEAGIELGSTFRRIAELSLGRDEALARLTPFAAAEPEMPFHPALLDACFQTLAAALLEASPTARAVLPYSLGRFELHAPARGQLWCHADLHGPPVPGDDVLGDLQIFDDEGRRVARIEALRLRPASKEALLASTRPSASFERTAGLAPELQELAPDERRPTLRTVLRQQVAKVLELADEAAIDTELPLRDQGLDSLTAIELHDRVESAVGRSLPVTVTFDHPTITSLADRLLTELGLGDAGTGAAAAPADLGATLDHLSHSEVIDLLDTSLESLD
ncbi:MAG: beta-ketoacyl synthase N-terminal-like domain-containing protein [Acidobacteriota bacterium]